MTKTKLLMIVILIVAVLAWLLSGILTADPPEIKPSLAAEKEMREAAMGDSSMSAVRGLRSTATQQSKTILLRGRTIDKDGVTVTAETSGQIVGRPVEIGDAVQERDVLCEVAIRDRQARFESAKDTLGVAKKEYESSLTLSEQGFQQELATARFKAAESEARRQLITDEIELENTKVRAPIRGVVDQLHVSVGDFIQMGSPCATIIVLDPIYAEGYLSEELVGQVKIGGTAHVTLPDGEVRTGVLKYLSKKADEQTRTFRLEVEFPNSDFEVSSGLSASIELVTQTYHAHMVPTSVVVLDEFGNIGVKTVNDDERVELYNVEIIREDRNGVWVAGLPSRTTVITVGQGFVVEGERVSVQLGD